MLNLCKTLKHKLQPDAYKKAKRRLKKLSKLKKMMKGEVGGGRAGGAARGNERALGRVCLMVYAYGRVLLPPLACLSVPFQSMAESYPFLSVVTIFASKAQLSAT